LKGKHSKAVKFCKSEIETGTSPGSRNRIKLVRSMLYSVLELTGNLDEVAELVSVL
jgi:hypothetical protein